MLFTGWNSGRSWGAGRLYDRGRAAFEADAYAEAAEEFARVRFIGPHSPHAADATFFRAASFFRMNDAASALQGYEALIAEYPESIWVVESHYHVGLCLLRLGRPEEAATRFRYVIDRNPANVWARYSRDELAKLGNSGGG
jgi:TolA-binding protein